MAYFFFFSLILLWEFVFKISVSPGFSFASLSILSRFFQIYFHGVVPGSMAFNFFLHCKSFFALGTSYSVCFLSFHVDLVSYRSVNLDSLKRLVRTGPSS